MVGWAHLLVLLPLLLLVSGERRRVRKRVGWRGLEVKDEEKRGEESGGGEGYRFLNPFSLFR